MNTYLKTLKKYWYWFLLLVVATTVLSFGVSIFKKSEYRSTVKLLVIQQQGQRLDAYTAARSAQAISETITKMVYTSSFFDRVLTSDFEIKNNFSNDSEKRKKEWKKEVQAKLADEAGTIQIDVFDEDPKQAEQIAFGIAYVIINYGAEYHGGGKQIEIKMVDLPLTSNDPVRPNVLNNTLAGLGMSILLSVIIIVLKGSKEVDKEDTDKNKLVTLA